MKSLPFRYAFPLRCCATAAFPLNHELRSPEFDVSGHTFSLLIFPWGRAKSAASCAFYLVWIRSQDGLEAPAVNFSLALHQGGSTCKDIYKLAEHQFSPLENDWGFTNFHDVATVKEAAQTKEKKLEFIATITSISSSCSCDHVVDLQPAGCWREESCSASFFSNASFSDCTVNLTDGTSLPAHRVILSRASSVFAALWASGTRESQEQQMRVEAEPEVATALLRYMYGLPVELEARQLPELLGLADMYMVPSLVESIVDRLSQLELGATVLVHALPALLRVQDSLPEQGRQQAMRHVDTGARVADDLSREEHFLSCWSLDHVRALLNACTGGAAAAAMAVKAAHRWVRHDEEHRRQHWAQLLQGVELSSLSAADIAAVSADAVDHTLDSCLLQVLLKRQLEAEAKEAGRGSG